ncbi:hypothetical protein BJ508DRAFT_379892 [Ascobolus immersus RN42]|uniref:Uncharacterized protein n=1 Tax=Ascobolus immersus RN42 TaxID=1160509 RepID=A0A3N4HPI0_ASCIM|nr:hypothetical protein BJ508DRAFT_379892 [Ascobolus immersus RN42]
MTDPYDAAPPDIAYHPSNRPANSVPYHWQPPPARPTYELPTPPNTPFPQQPPCPCTLTTLTTHPSSPHLSLHLHPHPLLTPTHAIPLSITLTSPHPTQTTRYTALLTLWRLNSETLQAPSACSGTNADYARLTCCPRPYHPSGHGLPRHCEWDPKNVNRKGIFTVGASDLPSEALRVRCHCTNSVVKRKGKWYVLHLVEMCPHSFDVMRRKVVKRQDMEVRGSAFDWDDDERGGLSGLFQRMAGWVFPGEREEGVMKVDVRTKTEKREFRVSLDPRKFGEYRRPSGWRRCRRGIRVRQKVRTRHEKEVRTREETRKREWCGRHKGRGRVRRGWWAVRRGGKRVKGWVRRVRNGVRKLRTGLEMGDVVNAVLEQRGECGECRRREEEEERMRREEEARELLRREAVQRELERQERIRRMRESEEASRRLEEERRPGVGLRRYNRRMREMEGKYHERGGDRGRWRGE